MNKNNFLWILPILLSLIACQIFAASTPAPKLPVEKVLFENGFTREEKMDQGCETPCRVYSNFRIHVRDYDNGNLVIYYWYVPEYFSLDEDFTLIQTVVISLYGEKTGNWVKENMFKGLPKTLPKASANIDGRHLNVHIVGDKDAGGNPAIFTWLTIDAP